MTAAEYLKKALDGIEGLANDQEKVRAAATYGGYVMVRFNSENQLEALRKAHDLVYKLLVQARKEGEVP